MLVTFWLWVALIVSCFLPVVAEAYWLTLLSKNSVIADWLWKKPIGAEIVIMIAIYLVTLIPALACAGLLF